jgi:hypothetical protein
MNFKPIEVSDKELITKYTYKSDFKNCDFAFSNMCSWQFFYESEFSIEDDFLFVRFRVPNKTHERLAYMFPVGGGNIRQAIEKLEDDAESLENPLVMLGMTNESKELLDNIFPEKFVFMADRNYFDYIYLRENLTSLAGKKLQPKRNHINKFNRLYKYEYIPITPEIAPECMALEQEWLKANVSDEYRDALTNERRSMCFALRNFEQLGLTGGAILIDNKIVAFTYGSKINRDTFGVHVEKADINYDGIFSVINQEFVSRLPDEFTYINREEDLGIEGLRKAKLSYNPVLLLEKTSAVKRRIM